MLDVDGWSNNIYLTTSSSVTMYISRAIVYLYFLSFLFLKQHLDRHVLLNYIDLDTLLLDWISLSSVALAIVSLGYSSAYQMTGVSIW